MGGSSGGNLIVETIARVRREHFVKGKTIKEIARDLGVSRNAVSGVPLSGQTSFECERTIQPRPKLGRWTTEGSQVVATTLCVFLAEVAGRPI
jgi:hypothetical protein